MFKLPHHSLIAHADKVILQIFQAKLQQYVNQEFLYVQAGFRKGRGIRGQIANICCIIHPLPLPFSPMSLHLLME